MKLQWDHEWQRLYVEALLETNPLNLVGAFAAAEVAILSRVEELCVTANAEQEWEAIEDAIHGLMVLKRGVLKSQTAVRTQHPQLIKPRSATR
jgi:hypothetical protein